MKRKIAILLIGTVFPCLAEAKLGAVREASALKSQQPFHEYQSKSGQVFAVSWQGRFNGDIEKLLGDYATDLQKYNQQHPVRSGRIHYRKVDAGRVIFEFWDLPKMVKGRAYIPGMMPTGSTTDDIR